VSTVTESSDGVLLQLLRRQGPMSISDLVSAMAVTATAVRQRLSRLMPQGLIERESFKGPRGRPGHRYTLTEKARRQAGSNFADLAMVMWDEVRGVKDPEVRRGLLSRIAKSLAARYVDKVGEGPLPERMQAITTLFAERGIPLEAVSDAGRPSLTVLECPYPELAEKDRGICAVEKLLFEELLDRDVRLSQCRLDGHSCCEFSAGPALISATPS